MESTRSQAELVHALRYSFEPSPKLHDGIQELLISERVVHPTLLSTKSIVVDGETFYFSRHRECSRSLLDAHRTFTASNESYSIAAVDYDESIERKAGAVGMRLLFWLAQQDLPRFKQNTSHIDELATRPPLDTVPENYEVYMDIPESKLASDALVAARLDDLNKAIIASNMLYFITPKGVTGQDIRRARTAREFDAV